MSSPASPRLQWTVDHSGIAPNSRVLEIGCGHGVAVSLICSVLVDGHVVAIDQSEKMIAATSKRNAAAISSGKASVYKSALVDARLDGSFDVVIGAHVPVFLRGNPAEELKVLAAHMKKPSTVWLTSQPPGGDVETESRNISNRLEQNGFVVAEVLFDEISGGPIVGVRSTK